MDKKIIRKEILEKRNLLSEKDLISKSQLISEKLLSSPYYKEAHNIFSFVSFASEVQTHQLIKTMLEEKNVFVPYTLKDSRKMIPSQIFDFHRDLVEGHYSILSPREDELRPIEEDKIDLILVPGLAFDREGFRVGYGGGYYDRFFTKISPKATKIGLAFDLQIIETCPRNEFDLPVDCIITEKDLIKVL